MPTSPDHFPRAPGRALAVLTGLVTACALAGLLVLTAYWYREHLWLAWDVWGLAFFFIGACGLIAIPGVLVSLLVNRQQCLTQALTQQDSTLEAARTDLARTNRAVLALRAVNHELLHAIDRDQLLQQVCQAMVEKSGYALVWVGLPEPGPDKRVRVAARAGDDARWLDALEIRYDASPRGAGPTGVAIREDRVVFLPRFQDEPFFKNWPTRPHGLERYASGISFPLRVDGRVAGALTIYEQQQRDFGQEEISLLTQMADDVAYGLQFLRLRQTRERTSHLLRQALRVSSAMSRTARELGTGQLDMAEMAGCVLQQALTLTGSPFGAVGMVAPRTSRLDWLAVTLADGTISSRRFDDSEIYPDNAGHFHNPFAATLNTGTAIHQNTPADFTGLNICPPGHGTKE